jgi:hypothetical protein
LGVNIYRQALSWFITICSPIFFTHNFQKAEEGFEWPFYFLIFIFLLSELFLDFGVFISNKTKITKEEKEPPIHALSNILGARNESEEIKESHSNLDMGEYGIKQKEEIESINKVHRIQLLTDWIFNEFRTIVSQFDTFIFITFTMLLYNLDIPLFFFLSLIICAIPFLTKLASLIISLLTICKSKSFRLFPSKLVIWMLTTSELHSTTSLLIKLENTSYKSYRCLFLRTIRSIGINFFHKPYK